jgi:hypothetical protein
MLSHDQPTPAMALHFDGTFDLAAARRLMDVMLAAPGDAEMYIDFTRVHEFRDNAVAVLSQALTRVGARVSVRGLRQHQYRLLQYLGTPKSSYESVH